MVNLQRSKVLVTGAGGFIGSHLAEMLVEQGASVRVLVHYNSANSWGCLERIPEVIRKELDIVVGDIRDSGNILAAMHSVDIVFHLGALIAIPFSYQSPESYVDTNVKGTLNVLLAAKATGVGRVLITSTSEVYGTALYTPIDEKHPRQGQSPYSATKIGADALAESFFRSFGLPVVTVRPFNTYGPRQSARAIIPTVISQIVAGSNEIRLGSLAPTRDLVFVRDTAEGFMRLATCDAAVGQDVNIATQKEISVGDLANKIITVMGSSARVVTEEKRLRPEKSEVQRLLGSNARLRELTGWQPASDLDHGLARTIEWYRSASALYKPGIYNV